MEIGNMQEHWAYTCYNNIPRGNTHENWDWSLGTENLILF